MSQTVQDKLQENLDFFKEFIRLVENIPETKPEDWINRNYVDLGIAKFQIVEATKNDKDMDKVFKTANQLDVQKFDSIKSFVEQMQTFEILV